MVLMSLWLSGCATGFVVYEDRFSEIHLSTDFKKILVLGSDKYSYVFDVPENLSKALSSPLRPGMAVLFPYLAFNVRPDGSIKDRFTVLIRDSFLQEHQDLIPLAESLGFFHGQLYSFQDYSFQEQPIIVLDGKPKPSNEGIVKNGQFYFLSISLTGQRLTNKSPAGLQDTSTHQMDRSYTVHIQDEQRQERSLLGPVAVVTGAGICVATFPACFIGALPVIGLKP